MTVYIPPHFRIPSTSPLLFETIRASPLATLVTCSLGLDGGVEMHATHLPMLLQVDSDSNSTSEQPIIKLIGHLAKSNPHWKMDHANPATRTLAIFRPPLDAYVSPGYYPTKKETGKVVPTWNYRAVHCTGRMEVVTEPTALLDIVSRLSVHHESQIGRSWTVSEAPEAYIGMMLKGIVGIVLHVDKMEGVDKMSQNRADRDLEGAIKGLEDRGKKEDANVDDLKAGRVAEAMKRVAEEKGL